MMPRNLGAADGIPGLIDSCLPGVDEELILRVNHVQPLQPYSSLINYKISAIDSYSRDNYYPNMTSAVIFSWSILNIVEPIILFIPHLVFKVKDMM